MNITNQRQSDSILDVLSSDELRNICGGSSNNNATAYVTGIAKQFISDSWNTFCSNFSQGYNEHIK